LSVVKLGAERLLTAVPAALSKMISPNDPALEPRASSNRPLSVVLLTRNQMLVTSKIDFKRP
jgi:hypothetical protein